MIEDGLFQRFPKPDVCLALHCDAGLPVGTFGVTSGPATASTDSVDIVVKGVGGHGAMPNMTKDPIVLASQIVLACKPSTAANCIPWSRSWSPWASSTVAPSTTSSRTRSNSASPCAPPAPKRATQVLDSIKRICRGLGIAAGLPENLLPEVSLTGPGTPSLHNDPELTARVTQVWADAFGKASVIERKATMAGEDFSRYTMTPDKIPVFLAWLGTVAPEKVEKAKQTGEACPACTRRSIAPKPRLPSRLASKR
jgi:metal-dependent amidase/aminoacylase/carboxypeptidase family protein